MTRQFYPNPSSATFSISKQDDTAPGQILFVASAGALFQGMVQVMRAHLPDYEVRLVTSLDEDNVGRDDVRLALFSLDGGDDAAQRALIVRESCPGAAVGVVTDGSDSAQAGCEYAFQQRLVQGILPLTLKLEVWLAALTLLLSGGEYYPPPFTVRTRTHDPALALMAPIAPLVDTGRSRAARGKRLTRREMQILELMSEGLQNKLIADRMSLAENTVKVHVHNVISKLRVSNRTQAAAAFRGRLIGRSPANLQ